MGVCLSFISAAFIISPSLPIVILIVVAGVTLHNSAEVTRHKRRQHAHARNDSLVVAEKAFVLTELIHVSLPLHTSHTLTSLFD
jgi:hypothetical protein